MICKLCNFLQVILMIFLVQKSTKYFVKQQYKFKCENLQQKKQVIYNNK